MSKATLIEAVKTKTELSGTAAATAVNAVLEAIEKGLKKEGAFSVPGFGTFKVTKRAARKGRNPATGEAIKIKAGKRISFKAGAGLKAAV